MCACVKSGGCAGADTAGLEFRWMQTLSDLLKTLNDAHFRVIGGLSVLAAWVETALCSAPLPNCEPESLASWVLIH